MRELPKGEKLAEECKLLGIDITGEPRTYSASGSSPRASDYELQRRLINARRSKRESRLWLVAIISAVASVFSALAAIIAVAT